MKTWKKFANVNAKTLDEAAALMQKGNAAIIAGGTDLLGALRFEILPTPAAGVKSAFIKFAIRKSIDFPIVNCAAAIGGENARGRLNAVHNRPYRVIKAEEAIKGKNISEANAEAAGDAAISGAKSLPGDRNKWKIQIAKAMVKRAILACA